MNKPSSGKTSQSERFIKTARELGCDEDEEAFKAKLRVIARQKPKPETPSAIRTCGRKSPKRD